MSWFSELTSKAEAMLVKLDQNTAQALQNPPQILTRAMVTDPNRNETGQSQTQGHQIKHDLAKDTDNLIDDADDEIHNELVNETNIFQSNNGIAGHKHLVNGEDPVHDVIHQDMRNFEDLREKKLEQDLTGEQSSNVAGLKTDSPSQTRKFKLQTSKLRPTLHNEETRTSSTHVNGYNRTSKRDTPLISLGADDIRASINKSLQEYSQSSSRDRLREEQLEQTIYSSHFDSQPNLISHSASIDDNRSSRIHTSPSFSINVPDDCDQPTNITNEILRQSALKKKSPFNLHKVINKLASQRGHSQSLLGDKTKIRLRRIQMRAASYLRRMNYYFQAYPTMKYWMIGYLVILQILVVYVLFFYQSSSSTSYLINQVKQQQRELAEPLQHSNSEKLHPYSSDQDVNRFR
jgi:hypothetical protein